MLKIYDSLRREKVAFEPIDPDQVRMYVCGITVYDYCHLGHARMLVAFDIVSRWMRAVGYPLIYVRNITDIDDKIIARANENGESIDALTARFIDAMNEDCAALAVLPPDREPRATASMASIIVMIETLLDKEYAYRADNGDVFYSVDRFDGYGRLSGKKVADLRAGARVETDKNKRDPVDFVLWKAAKPDEPSWDAPFGKGRPGWHIECSAMATDELGNHFDIHGGGMDLKFPHHENEIAQSCAATGEGFANLWMHNGFVNVDEEKMSKSLDNFFTIREVLKTYPADVVRFFLIGAHYRHPINYSYHELDAAQSALAGYYQALARVNTAAGEDDALSEPYASRFADAMNDDFNTPGAIAVLADLKRDVNRALESGDQDRADRLAAALIRLGGLLGILQDDAATWLKRAGPGDTQGDAPDDAEIEALIENRDRAREAKDWAESDRIRDQLKDAGVELEDRASGTIWRRR